MKPLEAGDPYAIGPYELLGRLGSGGMGEVFLGRPGRDGRPAAIKVARGEFADDAGFRRRFAREVQAAGKVDGRFTAEVLGADPEARRPWLATAYIPAASLADAVATSGVLPESSLRALLAGIAGALEAIHAAGLTHRDLKPANVLLADDGPRVIDFGISHSSEQSQLTRTGQAPGTPGYMAPEQLRGTSLGPHTDVFALGATLVYAATGEGPFGAGDPMSLMYRVLEDEPRLDGVPDGLRDALARCLAKDPEQRPTVAALRAEFAVPRTVGERRWLPPEISTMVALPTRLEPQRLDDPQGAAVPRQPDDPRNALATPRGAFGPPLGADGRPPSPGAAAPPMPPAYGTPPIAPQPPGAPGEAPKRRLSRRSLVALTVGGVAALGTGGTLGALEILNGGRSEGKDNNADDRGPGGKGDAPADDAARSDGRGSGPLPKVVSGKKLGHRPTVEKERGAPPKDLVVRTLIQGSGQKVRGGDHVKCHYVMQEWTRAKTVDSSFDRKETFVLQVGVSQVIKGWDAALTGRRAGSRLEVSVPPSLAYGDKSPSEDIPPRATMLSVIDILEVIHTSD
ncbi:protein kinase domain-containing protein [Streptomyces sp. 8N114]|uniref:protein kinase domain-containing protein n=1 Tax=Streptomyces sp. 8N114 TaxID=3457419 RepID=UPI003FD02F3F